MVDNNRFTKTKLTIVFSQKCAYSEHLTIYNNRFWCAYCNNWSEVETKKMDHVTIANDVMQPLAFKPKNPRLQPLRIPSGWTVQYNPWFCEVDPSPETVEDMNRCFFEDMLTLHHERYNRLLDLGWTPELDYENGSYKLVLLEGDFKGKELYYLETKSREELVTEIERLLQDVTNGEI